MINCGVDNYNAQLTIHDMHIDVTDPEWVANGSIMAGASSKTVGAPSSCTRITYLDYKNCPENQRWLKLRFRCAYFHLSFQIQDPD